MNRKILTPELKQKVEVRVQDILKLSSTLYPNFKDQFETMPEIRYDVKNRFAGFAITGGADDWSIRLNPILCYENEEDFIKNVVGHEVAHLVARRIHGYTKEVKFKKAIVIRKIQSHGPEWRKVMQDFGLVPARCHKYDTSSIEIKSRSRHAKHSGQFNASQSLKIEAQMKRHFHRLDPLVQQSFTSWVQESII